MTRLVILVLTDTSSLLTTTNLITKMSEVETKISYHAKYITTQKYNELTAENVAARLK